MLKVNKKGNLKLYETTNVNWDGVCELKQETRMHLPLFGNPILT